GGIAVIALIIALGPRAASWIVFANFTSQVRSFIYMSIPMFIFMANMLERSGIAEDMYLMMYRWLGRLKGGLAMGTV
ncbi:MAG: TRAP transporter large permease subunit, partial [Aliifodinibius sp.]|nr:TRAP transporter large permease subunit [Fodinibius sp.]NIY26702.1 TRAP transporter large permease subunit [Fodinibius sp.]